MHLVRKLVREVHRRSVWQVIGIYLAGSWGVLQAVDYLTEFAGLPEWTPTMALILLLIGLPVTVATAFIQEGVPGLTDDPNEEIDPNELEGLTPSEVHRDPAAHPLAKAGVFTWRNAVLGGVGAGVLLMGSVAAYLVMWAFGIGPVGSLVAQGVLDERDPILLAEFENRTPDPTLGVVVTDALRVDLLQSQMVTVVDGRLVDEVLQRMGRPTDEVLTGDVAREVAVREGIKAVVEGDVSRVGSGYLLAARIVVPDDGTTLAAFRESVEDDDGLLRGIDRISQSLREKAGESLRDIRASEPLEAVTTSSLEALRLFAQAGRADEDGDVPRAIALLEDAVALDSTFAMAWRKLAVQHSNRGGDYDAQVRAASAAYRFRDRLTARERYLTEAYYHYTVTQDEEATAQAYRRVLDAHPHDPVALNNLGLIYLAREEWHQASELYQRAVSGPGRSRSAYNNLVIALFNEGKKEDAVRVLDEWAQRYPFEFGMARQRFQVLWGMGDAAGARQAALDGIEALPEDAFAQIGLRSRLAGMMAARGQLGEARGLYLEARGIAEARGAAAQEFAANQQLAWLDLLAGGDTLQALRGLERRFEEGLAEIPPLNRPYGAMAWLWTVIGGDAERGAHYWSLEREAMPDGYLRSAAFEESELLQQALIATAKGDPATALERLRDVRRRNDNCRDCLVWESARTFEALEQPDSAIAYYQRFLEDDLFDAIDDRESQAPDVLPRLARLYEEVGRTEEAAAAWARFAEVWADADAVLQPRVTSARAQVARLRGGGG